MVEAVAGSAPLADRGVRAAARLELHRRHEQRRPSLCPQPAAPARLAGAGRLVSSGGAGPGPRRRLVRRGRRMRAGAGGLGSASRFGGGRSVALGIGRARAGARAQRLARLVPAGHRCAASCAGVGSSLARVGRGSVRARLDAPRRRGPALSRQVVAGAPSRGCFCRGEWERPCAGTGSGAADAGPLGGAGQCGLTAVGGAADGQHAARRGGQGPQRAARAARDRGASAPARRRDVPARPGPPPAA